MVKGKPGPKPAPKNSAKKPDKAPKPRKAKAAAPSVVAGANSVDPDTRALFLKDKSDYLAATAKLGKAQQAVRALGKTIKSDGFTIRQIKLSIELDTPEGEAEFKARIADDLRAAQYSGAPIGAQLTLFIEPDRTPSVDMAFDEGTKDCMEGKTANPRYAPETAQYRRYLEGYHAETERRVTGGIKKKEPDTDEQKARAAALAESRDRTGEAEKFH